MDKYIYLKIDLMITMIMFLLLCVRGAFIIVENEPVFYDDFLIVFLVGFILFKSYLVSNVFINKM